MAELSSILWLCLFYVLLFVFPSFILPLFFTWTIWFYQTFIFIFQTLSGARLQCPFPETHLSEGPPLPCPSLDRPLTITPDRGHPGLPWLHSLPGASVTSSSWLTPTSLRRTSSKCFPKKGRLEQTFRILEYQKTAFSSHLLNILAVCRPAVWKPLSLRFGGRAPLLLELSAADGQVGVLLTPAPLGSPIFLFQRPFWFWNNIQMGFIYHLSHSETLRWNSCSATFLCCMILYLDLKTSEFSRGPPVQGF